MARGRLDPDACGENQHKPRGRLAIGAIEPRPRDLDRCRDRINANLWEHREERQGSDRVDIDFERSGDTADFVAAAVGATACGCLALALVGWAGIIRTG